MAMLATNKKRTGFMRKSWSHTTWAVSKKLAVLDNRRGHTLNAFIYRIAPVEYCSISEERLY